MEKILQNTRVTYAAAFLGIGTGKSSGSVHFILKRAGVVVVLQRSLVPPLLALLFGVGQRLGDDHITDPVDRVQDSGLPSNHFVTFVYPR